METIRSLAQPLTHNLPQPIAQVGTSLLGPHCYKTLVLDIDGSHTACVKLAVSKGLGIGIIGASSIVKVPQLIKLLSSGSAQGVSFVAYVLESSAYLISLAYNARHGFPFSTYGETALILVQNVVIASLVLRYGGSTAGVAAWVGALAAGGWALFDERVVSGERLGLLQAAAGVLGVASKVPQIVTVWEQGGTGQLSAFAVANYLLGSLSRIFTTVQEVHDPLILYGFVAGFALNLVLFLQVLYYWNAPAPGAANEKAGRGQKKKKSKSKTDAAAEDNKDTLRGAASGAAAKSPSTRRRG